LERNIYIYGLPPLFAEKDRDSLRKEREGSINHKKPDIGKVTQKKQMERAKLSNDLKVKEQLKIQNVNRIKGQGDFCYKLSSQNPFKTKRNLDKNQTYHGKDTSKIEIDENILVLTDLEQFLLDTFNTMQNSKEKEIIFEIFLSRVKNNKDKLVNEIQKKQFCSADEVFKRVEDLNKKNKQLDLDNLSKEYNNIKEELRNLKRNVQILDLHNSDNIET
jgi:hypothetical protein